MTLVEKIYNEVYAKSKNGKQIEYSVSEEIAELMKDAEEGSIDAQILEELLSSAAGIGLVHGFKGGMFFLAQIILEVIGRR